MTFPNERPITQAELIELAEDGAFSDFDSELDSTGYSETRTDFDFSMVGNHLVARPKPGNGGNIWGRPQLDCWIEDISVDQNGTMINPAALAPPPPPPLPSSMSFPVHSGGSSVRMTGGQNKDEFTAPPGIGKSESNDNFFAFLDEAIVAGESTDS